ncbi:hypothetical protein [Streptomyces rochei]|uniref:hypothetical protein n=1 Tax=Streptomyces rochei TaxID=1928 RepID=UPI00403A5799
MTDEQVSATPRYVVRTEVIRWAIDRLSTQRIHPFFLAYLYLHSLTPDENNPTPVSPIWGDLGKYLVMPGGPPNKPFYRPFFTDIRKPERYWLNANLAGSWAPSSLRQVPKKVVDVVDDGLFLLKENSAELALQHLLYDEPVPALALSAYMLRNYAFSSDEGAPSEARIRALFLEEFNFRLAEDGRPLGDADVIFSYEQQQLPTAEICHPYEQNT